MQLHARAVRMNAGLCFAGVRRCVGHTWLAVAPASSTPAPSVTIVYTVEVRVCDCTVIRTIALH